MSLFSRGAPIDRAPPISDGFVSPLPPSPSTSTINNLQKPISMTTIELKSFNYAGLTKELLGYANEVKVLIKTTITSAVRIGQILEDVKTNILSYGDWQKWVDSEFGVNIKHDSADNFINLYRLVAAYGADFMVGIEKLSLSSLYILSRPTVEPDLKTTILKLAAAEEPQSINREEVRAVIQAYRKVKMNEANIDQVAANQLIHTSIAENPKELLAMARLSKKKQRLVSNLLANGGAESRKEALLKLRNEK
jgi:hypothetical protein